MRVLLEFKDSHHYFQDFEKTKLFCMNCGKQDVWEEQSGGDYYVGSHMFCISCNHCMYSCGKPEIIIDHSYLNQIEQIKTGICFKPTTKKGH